MRQVFISYSSREYSQANEIVRALEDQGIQCWIAPRNIGIGSNYIRDIPGGIRECPFFLLVLSRNSQASIWVEKELGQAIKQRREILPLLIEDCAICDGFDFILENVQIRSYYRDKDAVLRELISHIQGEPPAKAPAPQSPKTAPAPQPPTPSVEECLRNAAIAHFFDGDAGTARWYQKAADLGYAKGQYLLAQCYEKGSGVELNWSEALRLYHLAADQGDAEAQYKLAQCYENGSGVNLNWSEAVRFYHLAARQGHDKAQYILGQCYENGSGVPKKRQTAIMWYQKATDQGNKDAKKALRRLKWLI